MDSTSPTEAKEPQTPLETGSSPTEPVDDGLSSGSFSKFIKAVFDILVVSIGFMIDAYDLFVIGMILVIIDQTHPSDQKAIAQSFISVGVLAGTFIGQLVFGFLSDKVSRKKMFLATLGIVITFAAASAFSFEIRGELWYMLALFRFLLGIGIGGEYPLSATVAAETATNAKTRGTRMAIVFSMQGLGNFMAPLFVYLLVLTTCPLEYVWRIALGFGALPPLAFAYSRYKRDIMSVKEQVATAQANSAVETTSLVPDIGQETRWTLIKKHKWTLVGTALTWLLLDITFYANGLFKETVVNMLGLAGGATAAERVTRTALASLSMASVALPGYWVSIFLIDRWGRRPIQLLGFAAIASIFLILGAAYKHIVTYPALFFIIYGLTFFFSNFGANTTTYIIPGEAFPVSIRATCHGISAASGKVGAVIGVSLFPYMEPHGLDVIFYTCAGIAVLGLIVTLLLVPETKGLELSELNAGRVVHGYATAALKGRKEARV